MKNKLILIGPAHPLRGGIAAFNHQMARAFQEQGWLVKMISYSYQYPNLLFPGKDQYTDDPAPPDLEIEEKLHSLNVLSWNKLAKYIVGEKPHLVIAQYWMPFIGIALAPVLKKIKKLDQNIISSVLVHNLIPHETKPGDKYFTKKILKAADSYISISNAVGDDILQVNSEVKLHRMFFPILNQYGELIEKTEAKRRLGLDEQINYLLFFGLVRKYKGLDILIKALPLLKQENLKLLVAGEFYEDFAIYEKLINDFNLKEYVIFRNQYIPEEQVRDYFSAADVVVLPYRTATQSGITQMALHFEKAIISTNVGGLHEVVKNGSNGYLVEPDSKQIALAIELFYSGQKEEEFSLASKELKEKLSWPSFYHQLIDKLKIG